MYWVYVLKSIKSDRTYIGFTENLAGRVEHHNGSRARWTKRHQPWILIHHEEFETRGQAVKRERYLKKLKGMERYLDRIAKTHAGVTQLVESQPSKLLVAGSSPVSRSTQS